MVGTKDVLHYMRASKTCLHTMSDLLVKALPNPYPYICARVIPKTFSTYIGRVGESTSLVLKHLSSLIHVSHAMDKCYKTHVHVHNIPCVWNWLETHILLTPWYMLSPITQKSERSKASRPLFRSC